MRFLRAFLLTTAAGLALLTALLIAVNPRGVYSNTWFPQPRPNYRAQKLRVLDRFRAAHEAQGVILGSSRAGRLDPEDLRRLTGLEFFSMTVLGADAEDYLATWRLYLERQPAPKVVLIGLDADAFRPNDQSDAFKNTFEFVTAFEGRRPNAIDRLRHELRYMHSALTASYIADAVSSVRAAFHPPEIAFVFRDDGVLNYPRWDRQIAEGSYPRANAITGCADRRARLGMEIDTTRLAALGHVLREARERNVHVIIWITPAHPVLLGGIENNPTSTAQLISFRDIVRRYARQWDAQLVDLTRIESFGGDPDDWYDCVHFGRKNAPRIAKVIADTYASVTEPRE